MPDLAGELGLLFLLPVSKAAANLWETLHVTMSNGLTRYR